MKLNIQKFAEMNVGDVYASPEVQITSYGYSGYQYAMMFTVRLNSQSISSNTSNITIVSYLKTLGADWGWYDMGRTYMRRYIKVNTELNYTLLNETQLRDLPTNNTGNWVECGSWTGNVTHDSSSECSLYVMNYLDTYGDSEYGFLPVNTEITSSELELHKLHKPPYNLQYDITETNQQLINVGITDDTFVKDLSIKEFDISADTYDQATITKYAVYNNGNTINYEESTTTPITYNFKTKAMDFIVENNVVKTPIRVVVYDRLNTATLEDINYSAVLYNKIVLDDENTIASRLGQTSGRVELNIKGTCYNESVGNINQGSGYKPTIKYKFWKYGTSEPSTYDYTIPSNSITITSSTDRNLEYTVTNYDIGSIVETDPNYFDYKSAYRIKIKVNDNFTEDISSEKGIAVGEAIFTEYEDRVDFKKITRQNKEIFSNVYVIDDDIVIGEATNGKPIYRRTVEFYPDFRNIDQHFFDVGLTNVADVYNISYRVINGAIYQTYNNALNAIGITIGTNNANKLTIYNGVRWSNTNLFRFSIEFTKSTD